MLWWDGQGLCLFAKRLEKGHFVWSSTAGAAAALTPAQLAMLLEASTGARRCAPTGRRSQAESGRLPRWPSPWSGPVATAPGKG